MPITARQTTTRLKTARITKREKEMVVTLFLDGYRPHEIAEQMRRGYITVAAAITDVGYTPERFSYTEREASLWADMYEGSGQHDKHCIREIAEFASEYAGEHVPPSRVSTALLRRGARMRHPALGIRIAAEKRRQEK